LIEPYLAAPRYADEGADYGHRALFSSSHTAIRHVDENGLPLRGDASLRIL
jgi:hypothetical protein